MENEKLKAIEENEKIREKISLLIHPEIRGGKVVELWKLINELVESEIELESYCGM